MSFKLLFLLLAALCCECVCIYSNFWAPLFNPRILNYKVDFNFDPDGGKNAREEYEKKYGYRGERLIADFGNGKGPIKSRSVERYGDVKFYYTYPGADKDS